MKLVGIAALLALAIGPSLLGKSSALAEPCVRKDFKTEMVKTACEKGGQAAAKDAMKAFNKDKKIKSCNQCHSKLAPNYELKADGVEQYKKLGGKMLDLAPPPPKDTKPAPPAKDAPAPTKDAAKPTTK